MRVEDLPPPVLGPGQVRVRVARGRGQLPRRAARRERVPDQGAAAVRARAASSPASSSRSPTASPTPRGGRPRLRDGALRRVRGGSGCRRRDRRAASRTASTTGTRPPSGSRIAPPTTCSVRSRGCEPGDELIVLGAAGGVGLAAVQTRRHPRRLGHGGRVVAGAARGRVGVRRPQPHRLSVARPAAGAARGAPRRRRRRDRPGRRRSLRAGAARTSLRRPLRHGRLRVRRHPQDPAQPPAAEGRAACSASSCSRSSSNEPDEFERNERELFGLLASHRVVPHIGATFSLDDAAAALQYVADRKAIGKVVIDIA